MSDTQDESLGRKLVRALKNSAGVGRRDIEVEHEGSTASAKVHGSGPYGSSLDRLIVQGPDRELTDEQAGEEVQRQARKVAEDVTYLPERFREHEVDSGLGGAILRSRPEEMRGREYSEVELKKGREADVSRYRYDSERTERHRIPQQYAHETVERLTDDLDGALRGDEEEGG